MQGIPQHYPVPDAQMRGPARAPREASEDFASMLAALDARLTERTADADAAPVPLGAVDLSEDEAEPEGDAVGPDAKGEADADAPTRLPAAPRIRDDGAARAGHGMELRGRDAATAHANVAASVAGRGVSDMDAKAGKDTAHTKLGADHRGQPVAQDPRARGAAPLPGSIVSGREAKDGQRLAPRAELRSGAGEVSPGATQSRNGAVTATRDAPPREAESVKAHRVDDSKSVRADTRAMSPRHMTLAAIAQISAGGTEMTAPSERRDAAAQMTHPGSLGAAQMSVMAGAARGESLLPLEKAGAKPVMRSTDVLWRSPTSDTRAAAFPRPAVTVSAPYATHAVRVPDSVSRDADALRVEREVNAVAQIHSTVSRSDSSVLAPPVTPGGTPLAPACLQIIEAVRHADQRIVHLQLAPAELGRLRIMLSATESGLQVVVTCERAETMELLRRNSGALMRELSDLGFDGLDLRFGEDRGAESDERDDERLHSAEASPASEPSMELPSAPHKGASDAKLDLRC
jgi:flagellar hook-length control protein FliK